LESNAVPISTSENPRLAAMPWYISGSRLLATFLVELGALVIVALTMTPELSSSLFSSSNWRTSH
jgi:hypothetical protein